MRFFAPSEGTLCITVINGKHSPPQGGRISSAWLGIDDEMVFGPEVFSQQVEVLQRAWPISAGHHDLAVKLASVPGSFLGVELSLLVRDTIPPTLSVEPSDGALITSDTPLLRVIYQDDGSGIESSTLMVILNGENVTDRFEAGENEATWQVPMDSFLDEGANRLVASISDRQGNVGIAESVFEVQVPTSILLEDFSSAEPMVRQRSAYKLIFRREQITRAIFRLCLRQLNDTPEPRAASQLGEILRTSESDALARALAAGAIGESARVDSEVGARADLVQLLGEAVHNDTSLAVKNVAARALGLTMNEAALAFLDDFMEHGPSYPPEPPDCDLINRQRCNDYLVAVVVTVFQVMKSAIRIAGHDHVVGNPGDIMEIWKKYHRKLDEYLVANSETGGEP